MRPYLVTFMDRRGMRHKWLTLAFQDDIDAEYSIRVCKALHRNGDMGNSFFDQLLFELEDRNIQFNIFKPNALVDIKISGCTVRTHEENQYY